MKICESVYGPYLEGKYGIKYWKNDTIKLHTYIYRKIAANEEYNTDIDEILGDLIDIDYNSQSISIKMHDTKEHKTIPLECIV